LKEVLTFLYVEAGGARGYYLAPSDSYAPGDFVNVEGPEGFSGTGKVISIRKVDPDVTAYSAWKCRRVTEPSGGSNGI
jgi:hypothetical protein